MWKMKKMDIKCEFYKVHLSLGVFHIIKTSHIILSRKICFTIRSYFSIIIDSLFKNYTITSLYKLIFKQLERKTWINNIMWAKKTILLNLELQFKINSKVCHNLFTSVQLFGRSFRNCNQAYKQKNHKINFHHFGL